MEQPCKVHIALGSNKGDRLKALQDALIEIHLKVGNVIQISRVYKSPAFGFKGEEFYNACISVSTYLKPNKIMKLLLVIEKALGRERSKAEGF